MRKAAATRVLALFRFFFLSGLPPLLGTRGAKVTWATNSFSVGKRLRLGPYSLITTSTVSTPMASICVISTPLMRYNACRFASCPRRLIALVLLSFFSGGAVSPPLPWLFHLSQSPQDFLLIGDDPLLHGVVHLERLLQAEQVILPPVSGQLLGDFLLGFVAASVTQLRQLLGIAFAGGDGTQDGHSRHPIDVGYRTVHAYVHLVQALLHPPQPIRTLRHQVGFIPHQGSQHADRFLGPERTPQQSATVQPLKPLAIAGIGFLVPPRYPRQLARIHQQDLQTLRF